ncbi:MAG: hypothetical protein IJY39_03845 [Clostridia bacterium]|nr:hypothetical protein [Clostridia bacterium]
MTDTTNVLTTEMTEEIATETVEIVEVETYATEGNVNHMLETLPMMGKGMLGIFLVTIIIIVSVAILNRTTSSKKKEN